MTTSPAGYAPRSIAAWLLALLMFLALAACGGSGAGAGGGGDLGGSQAQSLTLLSDANELESDGSSVATITAVVKDAGNRAIANQNVEFATMDDGATLQITSARTDTTGKATALLSTTNPLARTITVRASVQGSGIEDTRDVRVSGTAVSINGPQMVAYNTSNDFAVLVRDSASSPIPGVAVTLGSANGSLISPSQATTDAQGQAKFSVTASGSDTLTASALGVSTSHAIAVSDTLLQFINPTELELDVGTSYEVRARLQTSGTASSGQAIQFTTTRGYFGTPGVSTVIATTDGNGEAAVNVTSVTAGYTSLTATEPGGAIITRAVEFVATDPTKLILQASPAVVGANLSPAGTNASQLIAVVRDVADNPVKNVRVIFSSADPSNGRIDPPIATTDSAGVATSSFIPGANSTGPDGVVLRAEVQGVAAATTAITVARRELSVVIGTGNTIEEPDSTTYRMPWSALVTDSSGAPVVGAKVTVQLEPLGFRTGEWVTGGSGSGWTQIVNATCASEDVNRNAQLDDGEDITIPNIGTIGRLDPGQVAAAVITSAGGVTDAMGEAKISINYSQGFGAWVRQRLRVTISAPAGTEGAAVADFWLPVLAADIQSADVSPPGDQSPLGPFGTGVGCPAL